MSFILHSMAAGLSIALGGYAYLSVESRYLGALLFSVGLYVVCQYRIPLYTGRIAYLGRPGGYKAARLMQMLLFNLIGAAAVGLLFVPTAAGQDVTALMANKLSSPLQSAFIRGLMCGMLVFLAVDIASRFQDPFGRYLGILLGVPAFILAGFEHCIADMFYLAAAWKMGLPFEAAPQLLFLLTVILGNSAGALLLNLLMPQPVKEGGKE